MEMIKEILIDSFNGFSPKFIPFFLFQLLTAAFMGHLLNIAAVKKFKISGTSVFVLIATLVCLLAALSKFSLTFAVLSAAVILLLLASKRDNNIEVVMTALVSAIGVGCGTGSVVQTFIGFVFVLLVIVFIPVEKQK